jgi:hypothetical protein
MVGYNVATLTRIPGRAPGPPPGPRQPAGRPGSRTPHATHARNPRTLATASSVMPEAASIPPERGLSNGKCTERHSAGVEPMLRQTRPRPRLRGAPFSRTARRMCHGLPEDLDRSRLGPAGQSLVVASLQFLLVELMRIRDAAVPRRVREWARVTSNTQAGRTVTGERARRLSRRRARTPTGSSA